MSYSLKSRISLAGAQSKIGLYLAPGSKERAWFLPRGAAPSTHILKACNSVYPNETVNEAICLRAARLFEIDTPDCFLIRAGGTAPILVVERYDREIPSAGARHIGGLAVPRRLHQVDACQASGLLGADFKYEPSGVSYLNRLASLISEMSPDPYQDRISLVYRQLFHFVIGNADNHLKNWSFLYDEDWELVGLAPLYDVLDTTIYENLRLEMGVSFGGSRRLCDVTRDMVFDTFAAVGVPDAIVRGAIGDTVKEISHCIERAASDLVNEGFPEARDVVDLMRGGMEERLAVLKG